MCTNTIARVRTRAHTLYSHTHTQYLPPYARSPSLSLSYTNTHTHDIAERIYFAYAALYSYERLPRTNTVTLKQPSPQPSQ